MRTRILSAILLIPVVLTVLVLGSWPFALFLSLFVLIAGFEYWRMLQSKGYRISLLSLWLLILLWMAAAYWPAVNVLEPGLVLLILVGVGWQLVYHSATVDPTASWALTLAGGMYLGVGGSYLLRLRVHVESYLWLLMALCIVWIADTGAYLVGRRWGQHKMAPALSPGKSWEGYGAEIVSGLLAGGLCGICWPATLQLQLTPLWGGALGGLLALVTPLGDFFISMIKREVGVKDTGALIPGHGGALDRLDSIFWSGILTWFFRELLLIVGN
ncbi:MAG: phosphatidate cytidylyltransferase [Chloroflexota bacterium]|nr:phosphatidate cytidylyltransferase [Chloroflexota bacterium]